MLAARASVWIGAVTLTVALAPPLEAPIASPQVGLALGACSGLALFAALARRPLPAGALAPGLRRRTLARALVLTGQSAYEEALWRGLCLGTVSLALGRLAGLVAATTLFAAAHVPKQGRLAGTHLLTGAVFGLVYIATGLLAAAIVAHALYNVLVGLALLAAPVRFGQSTATDRRPTIDSDRREEEATQPQSPSRAARSDPPAARLIDVHRSFGSTVALDGVSLELRQGEVLGLLGPNGAGKSTALAIMLGLRRPDHGSAELFGRDPRDTEARRDIGVVLQHDGFPWTLRVGELVDLVRAHHDRPRDADWLLERLDLTSLARRQAGGLSGGQRRRLALALALAGRPRTLFLDEPTAGLDVDGRRALWKVLEEYVAGGGAVLLTTHRLDEAEATASRIVVLASGRVLRDGTVDSVRAETGLARVTVRAARLPELPGALGVESVEGRHTILTDRSDELVAALVASGWPFSDLEVTRTSLEDAFVALTREHS